MWSDSKLYVQLLQSPDSTDSVMTTLGQDNLGFESWQRQEIFLHSKTSRFTLESTKPTTVWREHSFAGGGVKWLEHEADHLPPSSAVIENEWHCASTHACFTVCTQVTLPLPLCLVTTIRTLYFVTSTIHKYPVKLTYIGRQLNSFTVTFAAHTNFLHPIIPLPSTWSPYLQFFMSPHLQNHIHTQITITTAKLSHTNTYI